MNGIMVNSPFLLFYSHPGFVALAVKSYYQIPNPKRQIPNKSQIPGSKFQTYGSCV
jgi:hypothetical protein